MAMKRVNIAQVIGAGYKDFWFSQHRYNIKTRRKIKWL